MQAMSENFDFSRVVSIAVSLVMAFAVGDELEDIVEILA